VKHRVKKQIAAQGELGFAVDEVTRVPDSPWAPPDMSALPDRLEGPIAVDTETCDPALKAQGAGWAWPGGGHVAGYSVAAANGCWYLPVRHEGGGNVCEDAAKRWLRSVLSDPDQPKIFAHCQYDLGWMRRSGIEVFGPIVDVQWAEALLDEHRREYSLESIARDRLGVGKDEGILQDALQAYGLDKGGLHKLPARFVGPYAEVDALRTLEIWRKQEPLIDEADEDGRSLREVFDLEHSLIPLYLDMRWRGVRIDVDYVEQLVKTLSDRCDRLAQGLVSNHGFGSSPWATGAIEKALDAAGVRGIGRTATGKSSITQTFLERCGHPLAQEIVEWRKLDKLVGTFLQGQLLNQLHGDRVHGEIHPLKADKAGDSGGLKGTTTGRISMSQPNLQFIPTRTDDGKLIRAAFLPEEGDDYGSPDFNQQEVRLLVHFAYLSKQPGADEARRRFIEDPSLNYHKFAASLMGIAEYKIAKIINFAILYGRGVRETAAQLQMSEDETRQKFKLHEQEMPFAKKLSWTCQETVRRRGYLRSLSGRRMRFPLWEPADWDQRDGTMLPIEQARGRWPGERLERARIHKALNSLIQPSAADQTKMAMRALLDEGLGKHVLMQVHDELGCSVPRDGGRTAAQIKEVMEGAVELSVPSRADVKLGANWKEAKED
jgi:DNA polymerase I-like protein with 3'-5' exonuclease and polymerase domains